MTSPATYAAMLKPDDPVYEISGFWFFDKTANAPWHLQGPLTGPFDTREEAARAFIWWRDGSLYPERAEGANEYA